MKKLIIILILLPVFGIAQIPDLLLASQQQATPSDPYLVGDGTGGAPQAYFNATALSLSDGADTSTWADPVNGYDFVTWGTAPEFDNSLGYNQVIFDGVDEGLHMASNYAAMDFDPDGSNYTIIMHFGATTLDNFLSYSLHKGTTSTGQFHFRSNSSGNNMNIRSGGSSSNLSGIRPNVDGGYVVIRRSGGDVTVYLDDSSVGTVTPGASAETDPWSIGCRSDASGAGAQTMSLRKVVFYDYAADLTWLTSRYTNRSTE